MDYIKEELEVVKVKHKSLEGVSEITCIPAMVQYKIYKTVHKQLVVCLQFPEDYPRSPLLIELKSKALSEKLLDGLNKVCDDEARKIVGQHQVMPIIRFVHKFINENPLCVCSDEISHIKKNFITEGDKIVLKQKTSQVIVKLNELNYHVNVRLTVPDNYPDTQLGVEVTSHNFPEVIGMNVQGQSVEIARKCVQPPLKRKPKDPPFQPSPSLMPVIKYLQTIVRTAPHELCPVCKKPSLPQDPKNVINDHQHALFVERVYCNHLFHHGCLDGYLKTPPFTGGKKCPSCGNRIYHEKWKVTPELAEARWAHKEAKHRELSEVVDFLD